MELSYYNRIWLLSKDLMSSWSSSSLSFPIFPYLIPINIRTPLIFTHLACAKLKGASTRSTNVLNWREKKMLHMNEKNSKFIV